MKKSELIVSLVSLEKDELDRDGAIKRFEFAFELLWKTLKMFLEYLGVLVNSPRELIKSAYKNNLINDDETILDMLEDRNKTSNVYDEIMSLEIFERIKIAYLPLIEKIIAGLKNYLND